VLTALSATLATIAVWTHQTVFDTDRFMEVVGPALEDPAFYRATSAYVSDQVLEALDLDTRVTESLTQLDTYLSEALVEALDLDTRGQAILERFDRPSLTSLAPPITEALESRVTQVVDRFITSDEFRSRLPGLVRRSHEVGVALVRDDLASLPNVYVEDGSVRLNLIPIIADALRRVQAEIREFLPDITLPDAVSDLADEGRRQVADAVRAELPEDFGQLTVMSEQQLEAAQEAAARADRLVWAIVLFALILVVITIAVAPNRRRTAIQLGLGVAAGLVLGWVAIRRLEQAILAEILDPDGERVAGAILTEVLSDLGRVVVLVVVVALLAAVVAYLAGRPAWLDRAVSATTPEAGASAVDRWVAARHDPLRIAGIAVAVAAVFIVGFGLVVVIVTGGLLALYLWGISAARRRAVAAVAAVESIEVSPG
jgi:hypothetical protein